MLSYINTLLRYSVSIPAVGDTGVTIKLVTSSDYLLKLSTKDNKGRNPTDNNRVRPDKYVRKVFRFYTDDRKKYKLIKNAELSDIYVYDKDGKKIMKLSQAIHVQPYAMRDNTKDLYMRSFDLIEEDVPPPSGGGRRSKRSKRSNPKSRKTYKKSTKRAASRRYKHRL
jgi:hypothetical protein